MTQSNPKPHLDDHEAELNKAIDELRGVLHEDKHGAGSQTHAFAGEAAMANAGLVMNIMVDVQIVLGSAEVPVADLLSLQKGATIPLNRRIGEPVDVIVNGRKIARGEITVLDNDPSRFGIKVTEIVSAAAKTA